MKTCPLCGNQYPDSEIHCEVDGALLSGAVTAATRITSLMPSPEQGESAQGGPIECPRCGGKAQPGETICNFCGARLRPEAPSSPSPQGTEPRVTLESFTPGQEPRGPQEIGAEPTSIYGDPAPERRGRRIWSILGFSLAALVALIGGAWLALYLSKHPEVPNPLPTSTSSPTAAAGAPDVELAKTIPIQVEGDLAGALFRDKDSMSKVFASNKASLVEAYKTGLASDSTLHDGMIVRLHILSDGSVGQSTVRVSTAGNPSLDADVVKATSGWKFVSASSTGVDADFPVIFATNPADVAGIESALNAKVANLGPNPVPEYPPNVAPSPVASAVAPTEVAPPTPAPTAPAVVVPPPPGVRHTARPLRTPKPTISLMTRVTEELHLNPELRRVHAFTTGGAVTLFGKVFDDPDKLLAERTARRVSGVTGVVDNLTTDTQEWAQNQSRIQQELQNAGLNGVTVKVIGKSAYLSGEVKTELEKQRAVTITEAAAPVRVSGNLIRVAIGSIFGP